MELDELALNDFEAAVGNDPARWRALHNRGVSYALLGRAEDAEKDFGEALKLNPKYANSWFNRAELRREAGRYSEAVQDYSRSLTLSPKDTEALGGRARCFLKMERFAEAVEDVSTALEMEGSFSDMYVLRGRIHQAQRQWDNAATDFRRAVETDKSSVEAYRAAAWLMATCPIQRVRNPKLAVAVAERAAKLEKEQLQRVTGATYDVMAAAEANAGNPTKAVQFARTALGRSENARREDGDSVSNSALISKASRTA